MSLVLKIRDILMDSFVEWIVWDFLVKIDSSNNLTQTLEILWYSPKLFYFFIYFLNLVLNSFMFCHDRSILFLVCQTWSSKYSYLWLAFFFLTELIRLLFRYQIITINHIPRTFKIDELASSTIPLIVNTFIDSMLFRFLVHI